MMRARNQQLRNTASSPPLPQISLWIDDQRFKLKIRHNAGAGQQERDSPPPFPPKAKNSRP